MLARALFSILVALVLGWAAGRVPIGAVVSRDLLLGLYVVAVSILGIYTVMGVEAAVIGGAVVSGAALVGAGIYGLLGLAGRWANRG
jgi:hypothetical protein